jgi:hypothetical protein
LPSLPLPPTVLFCIISEQAFLQYCKYARRNPITIQASPGD